MEEEKKETDTALLFLTTKTKETNENVPTKKQPPQSSSSPLTSSYQQQHHHPTTPFQIQNRFSSLAPSSSSSSSLLLHPPYHDTSSRQSTILVGTFNLIATIVGGGVFSLPYSFEKAGIVPATIMMIGAALATSLALECLCLAGRWTGARSFGEVGRYAYGPPLETFMSGLLVIFLFFVLVAYMILVMDIWTPLVTNVVMACARPATTDDDDNVFMIAKPHLILLVILLGLSPFLLRRDLHALRHNCYVGFASITLLTVAIVYHAATLPATSSSSQPSSSSSSPLKYFANDVNDLLFAFPIMTLSYLCSFNALAVQASLLEPSIDRVASVLRYSVGGCGVLMYVFGLGGYIYGKDETQGNILLNFDDHVEEAGLGWWLLFLGRAGSGVTIMLAMPMMVLPCREALRGLLSKAGGGAADCDEGMKEDIMMNGEEQQRLLLTVENGGDYSSDRGSQKTSMTNTKIATVPKTKGYYDTVKIAHDDNINNRSNKSSSSSYVFSNETIYHVITTIIIIVICYVFAVAAPGVAIVWSLCGSSMAFIIGFIFPCACYIKIMQDKSSNSGGDGDKQQQKQKYYVIMAWVLLIISSMGAIACTIQTVGSVFFSND